MSVHLTKSLFKHGQNLSNIVVIMQSAVSSLENACLRTCRVKETCLATDRWETQV